MTDLAIGFGPYVTGADVHDAVEATIARWARTYLAEMARHDGQPASVNATTPTLPDFRSFPSSIDNADRFAEDQVPACVISVPGLVRPPERHGNGKLTGTWSVGIGVIVGATDRERTIRLAQLYAAAVRMLLLQNRSLGGFAANVVWMTERFTEPANVGTERTLVAGLLEFQVTVDNVGDMTSGPTTPIVDGETPTGFPTVSTPSMTVTGYGEDQVMPT